MDSALATTLINGRVETRISATDRGLMYGDGLFETIAVVDQSGCLWDRHMQRLQRDCKRLRLPPPNLATLKQEADRLLQGVERGVLKVTITRGVGGRGYRIPQAPEPTRILSVFPWPQRVPDTDPMALRVRLCETPVSSNSYLAGIKHLGRLDNVLARSEWSDPLISEGLMQDAQGHVVEGTQSNLFLDMEGTLVTPDLSCAGVAGVVRALVMDLAQETGVAVSQRLLTLTDLHRAQALYLSNSVMGIGRVRRLDDHYYAADYPLHPVMLQARSKVHEPHA